MEHSSDQGMYLRPSCRVPNSLHSFQVDSTNGVICVFVSASHFLAPQPGKNRELTNLCTWNKPKEHSPANRTTDQKWARSFPCSKSAPDSDSSHSHLPSHCQGLAGKDFPRCSEISHPGIQIARAVAEPQRTHCPTASQPPVRPRKQFQPEPFRRFPPEHFCAVHRDRKSEEGEGPQEQTELTWKMNSLTPFRLAGVRWRGALFADALHISCCRQKSTAPKKMSPSDCGDNTKDVGNALDKLFSQEQQASILHVLNTASDKELEDFKQLRGRKSIKIIEHREKFGLFQNLESLMNVPSFQYKTAVQVCNSILCPETGKKKRKLQENRVLGKIIKPDIGREKLKAVNSIVSIVFGTRRIAWAHLDREKTVLDWQQDESCSMVKGTYLSSVYLEEMSSVISKIPKADFYILEKTGLPIQNISLFPILLHFHIVEAMLYTLLNKTFPQDGQHRVLSMSRSAVGKHFELMIGGDTRTSGKELIKELFSESVLKADPRVVFPTDKIVQYRQMFLSTEQKRVEELYDSLLQALAFYELAVFDSPP
ncbi:PREDICTED: transcription elongation factor, mitochondrial [Elephantulus edwardii]|uniref:transcription elongation factor, mitochondrial n=1 Tax=Elephantulus edwardii TaxID=28737 RepID=UPI0003F08CD9|nr:PREDICTED: transcription elongation factor, mitochondrial [Elephantulus edwardii]